jgi:hypothetical protein
MCLYKTLPAINSVKFSNIYAIQRANNNNILYHAHRELC